MSNMSVDVRALCLFFFEDPGVQEEDVTLRWHFRAHRTCKIASSLP